MQGMMVHCGGQMINRLELDMIPMPEATDTYVPVSHHHLTDKLLTISQDILRDYTLVGENFAIARQGNQMFALLKFQKEGDQLGLSVAFRNSYDKSMSLGLAIGANVFICDNLAIQGDIAIMKKHTKNVWTALEDLAIATLYKASKQHQQIQADAELLGAIPMENLEAFGLLGVLFGEEIISPRQMTVVRQEWLKPSYEEFKARNAWSFYNAATFALKSTPPISIMEKHSQLHGRVMQIVN